MDKQKQRTKENKAQMLRRLVIKHGHESKKKNTCRVRGVVHEAGWTPLEVTAGQCFYLAGWVLTLFESHAWEVEPCGSVIVLVR